MKNNTASLMKTIKPSKKMNAKEALQTMLFTEGKKRTSRSFNQSSRHLNIMQAQYEFNFF
jgi:hypothetical protein